MAEPCRQEDKIDAIHLTLEDLKTSNRELMKLLTLIAEQGAFIKSLQEKSTSQEKDTDNLFNRMRDIEIKVEGNRVKVGFIVTAISVFVSGIIAWLGSIRR